MRGMAVASFVISAVVALLCKGTATASRLDFSISLLQIYRTSVLGARAERVSDLKIKESLTEKWKNALLTRFGFSQEELPSIYECINTKHQSELDIFMQHFVFSRHKEVILATLADDFPLPIVEEANFAERIKGVIKNGLNEQGPFLSYSGEIFNTNYYESQSFYDDISCRVIYVLSEQLCILKEKGLTDVGQYICQLFAWAGVARSVIDLCKEDRIKEWTIFGEGIPGQSKDDALLEFWGSAIPVPYRAFMLGKVGQFMWNSDPKELKNYGLVCHKNPGDLSFLHAVIDALFQPERLCDNLVRFIFDFATSSTFKRGQSAIMEWFCNALVRAHGLRFRLNYGGEACVRKIENDAKDLVHLREKFKDPEFVKIEKIYDSFSGVLAISDLCKQYSDAKDEFRSCSECYNSSYKTILERGSCIFLLERVCSALKHCILGMTFKGFSMEMQKFLDKFPFLIQCSIQKYARPFTLSSECFDVDAFKANALASLDCFLNGDFLSGEPPKLPVFDTWGEILKIAIRCLSFPQNESTVPAFDSSNFINQLYSEMDQSFLRRLFRHLDVIALETYATNYDDPNVGFELFKNIVSESGLIALE